MILQMHVYERAVRVADDDLSSPGLERGLDGGVDLLRHGLAEAVLLEALRPELLCCDDADGSFHICRDVYLHLPLLRLDCDREAHQ
ncbi:MAG: hypothetical protein H0W76_08815 [Pyrinomonadaceae bacterium]|nr:hypothetical protein [Pyrinomonadaceae bacterium]